MKKNYLLSRVFLAFLLFSSVLLINCKGPASDIGPPGTVSPTGTTEVLVVLQVQLVRRAMQYSLLLQPEFEQTLLGINKIFSK